MNIGHARRGMALIITLILLSVTLIMAVAFLALARRERGAVTTTTETTIARLATESALAAAQAQLAANIFASTNQGAYDYHVFVSTNYISPAGYDPKAGPAGNGVSATNVNYDYTADNSLYSVADIEQNIANLWLLPRAPVYVFNPVKGSNDFRFYLDLNRNGYFDRSGWVAETNAAYLPTGNNIFEAGGDPEWIGVLERPDQPHGPNNHFLARYAFLAQPIGNSLDLNYIHNQVLNRSLSASDGFFRNQGVGSWELNLASFLADLNTNQWGESIGAPPFYQYNLPLNGGFPNVGYAFDDARSLLSWRYNFNYNSLQTADSYFGNATPYNGASVFPNDNIDAYSDGPLQTTTANINESLSGPTDGDRNATTYGWPGSDNTNRFFSLVSDLFDSTKSSPAFYNRLWSAGISNSTYDRYTFYRLLDQLGTDSKADDSKLNVNYSNAVVSCNADGMVTNVSIVPGAETNLMPWAATNFFNAAADRLLRTYTANWLATSFQDYTNTYGTNTRTAFGITNIPVLVNGQFVYTPAVNRLLQLAANIYDAGNTNVFPSVFRPVFGRDLEHNLYVIGYRQVVSVSGPADSQLFTPYKVESLTNYVDAGRPIIANGDTVNAYGVPWIIGAKKGFPNFQMLAMVNSAQVTRKLQVSRSQVEAYSAATAGDFHTNQMYLLGITNNISLSFWNSYSNTYARPVTLYASDLLDMTLTNNTGVIWSGSINLTIPSTTTVGAWPGSRWNVTGSEPNSTPYAGAFWATNWSYIFMPQAIYRPQTGAAVLYSAAQPWDPADTFYPLDYSGQLGLQTTNRIQAYILDGTHVVDYVQLRGPNNNRNLSTEIADPNYTDATNLRYLWSTNNPPAGGPPNNGVVNQLTISRNFISLSGQIPGGNAWIRPPTMPSSVGSTPTEESEFFGGFFTASWFDTLNGNNYVNSQLAIQAPYTPSRTVYDYTLWQANDPLVHYLGSDLNFAAGGKTSAGYPVGLQRDDGKTGTPTAAYYDYRMGDRYQPWGRSIQMSTFGGAVDPDPYNRTYRDPLAWDSDKWDFPTNPLPTVGWLGRVHRGTPWQTVFLKSGDILQRVIGTQNVGTNTWADWTGDTAKTVFGNYFDGVNSAPVQDRLLFDLFTTRFNDNAVHGLLSVNQTHLAAWSAVLGGMIALSNSTVTPRSTVAPVTTYFTIDPAGPAGDSSVLGQFVNGPNGINATRANTNLFPSGVFTHVGDILNVPALTEASPFLNQTGQQLDNGISDEMYEWLPQQTLGLLHVDSTPRYVVYCYGQTLKPAPNSLVTASGQFFGLCTNYQITAENAARAVIRVDRHVSATGTNYTTVLESFNPLPPN